MRVVTWNCRRATASSSVWGYLDELDPDVLFLQEVCSYPDQLTDRFSVISKRPVRKTGAPQNFSSLLMVRGKMGPEVELTSPRAWVRQELLHFSSNVFAVRIEPTCFGGPINAVCVYSPAWPVERVRLEGADVSAVRLEQNRDVWVTDLLREGLRNADLSEMPWIVAGDFNLCETFDAWRGGPRGNREYLDGLAELGLADCLREAQGSLTPTFRTLRSGLIKAQIDYVFVTDTLLSRLIVCRTGPEQLIHEGVSDHLPVVSDFGGGYRFDT